MSMGLDGTCVGKESAVHDMVLLIPIIVLALAHEIVRREVVRLVASSVGSAACVHWGVAGPVGVGYAAGRSLLAVPEGCCRVASFEEVKMPVAAKHI